MAANASTHGQATARPRLARDNTSTDRLLSYYQSSLADKGPYSYDRGRLPSPARGTVRQAHHTRESSVGSSSSSSSDYSADSPLPSPSDGSRTTATPPTTSSAARIRRRSSVPSEGGEDRRRLAIVEMDSPTGKHLYATSETESQASANNLLSRRGLSTRLGGLALMAPPDAAPRTYTQLTPPSTAPITDTSTDASTKREGEHPMKIPSPNESSGLHHRSASEAASSSRHNGLRHKSSRDVGIVGTSRPMPPLSHDSTANAHSGAQQLQCSLKPPEFQQPQSRSPSPGGVSDVSDSSFRRNLSSAQPCLGTPSECHQTQPLLTPEIGQEKQIGAPVASPVVLALTNVLSPVTAPAPSGSVSTLTPQSTSPPISYLHYQPGFHATAGPLPPPPKAFGLETNSPPPPRPPRLHSPPITRRRGDIDAVRQALQLPPSVSAVLASKIPPTASAELSNIREGASPNAAPPISHPSGSNDSTLHHRESSSALSTTAAQGSHFSAKPVHRREGAFSPSAGNSLDSSTGSVSGVQQARRNDSHLTVIPQKTDSLTQMPQVPEEVSSDNRLLVNSSLHVTPTLTLSAGQSYHLPQSGSNSSENGAGPPVDRVTINVAPATPAVDNETHLDSMPKMHPIASDDGSDSDHGPTPSPPPKSLRNSWTANLKLFSSLPRTPSPRSKRSSTGSSLSRSRASRTPSPSPSPLSTPLVPQHGPDTPHTFPHSPPRVKYISPYPPAMYSGDVTSRKTVTERCAGYAAKINELYYYDCGLASWLVSATIAGSSSPKKQGSMLSSSPSHGFSPQTRHTSGSSMTSEVTFPRRPDATQATDLSYRPSQDSMPTTSPPPLPYPSLAIQPPSRSSTMVSSSPSSFRTLVSPTSSKTGFFASLGRRASLKKERPHPSMFTPHPPNRLVKSTPRPDASPHPRPINIANSPSVPGGPRAPPNRVGRASTLMVSPPSKHSSASRDGACTPSAERKGVMTRGHTMIARPPQNRPSSSGDDVLDIRPDPNFVHQVDRLADLLPHADRDILAGYLHRAGQDMLAIGQYLEDEKNGTLRRD